MTFNCRMVKRGPKSPLTNEHKAALAAGRTEGKVVRDYLEALKSNKPKRGRKRTPESINNRLDAIKEQLPGADPIQELLLTQEQMDLEEELARGGSETDISGYEAAFVKVAKGYSGRRGISYAAWRKVGVDPSVLRAAGITRGEA